MPAEKRKPRNTPLVYHRKPKAGDSTHQTTTQKSRQNLTLADWLTVFAYIDAHPFVPQKDVVKHFATLKEGALLFTQPTLSRKLNDRSNLQDRVHANPSALSSKRPRVVTRPDVEKALLLWVKHMQAKGEQINRQMLKGKRCRFEDLLNVPDEERLLGDGWVASFCRTYKIREERCHGKAGSVDLDAVATEQVRVRGISFKAAPRDQCNPNETSFVPLAPPTPVVPQLDALENDVAQLISDLQARNRIFGTPPTLDEFLEPPEEAEIPDSAAADVFDGPGGDKAIVAEVVQEMAEKNNEVIDIDSDDEDEPSKPVISRAETINLCEKLMDACLQHADPSSDLPLNLLTQLRRFRAFLHREEPLRSRQITLDAFLARLCH